jgi:hypothetical protein
MLRPSRYILIDRNAWAWVYKVLIAKWRPSQHQYKEYHRYGGKNSPSPQIILLKNLKTSKNFKKSALPPLKICESVTLTKFFFYLA